MKMSGKPDAGNLHVRFDEGDQTHRLVPTLPQCQRFYESDCQGQTSSVLIALAFLP